LISLLQREGLLKIDPPSELNCTPRGKNSSQLKFNEIDNSLVSELDYYEHSNTEEDDIILIKEEGSLTPKEVKAIKSSLTTTTTTTSIPKKEQPTISFTEIILSIDDFEIDPLLQPFVELLSKDTLTPSMRERILNYIMRYTILKAVSDNLMKLSKYVTKN